jgi:hypothetical protein
MTVEFYSLVFPTIGEMNTDTLARISHSGVDFGVAERERTGERTRKAAVVR